ncbi:MAG: hypothetical protein LN415_08335 [Candidatus Thermoplasmatota archaeon]|nr:hypothetical protein [Candidatus Thermoplasmatota archaeon]
MIELRIRFWTNDIDGNPKGAVTQRVCWDSGLVYVVRNKSHGIESKGPSYFKGLCHLLCSVEKVLEKHDIKLEMDPRTPDVYRK